MCRKRAVLDPQERGSLSPTWLSVLCHIASRVDAVSAKLDVLAEPTHGLVERPEDWELIIDVQLLSGLKPRTQEEYRASLAAIFGTAAFRLRIRSARSLLLRKSCRGPRAI